MRIMNELNELPSPERATVNSAGQSPAVRNRPSTISPERAKYNEQ